MAAADDAALVAHFVETAGEVRFAVFGVVGGYEVVLDVWEGGEGVRFDVGAEVLGLLVFGPFCIEQACLFFFFFFGLRFAFRIDSSPPISHNDMKARLHTSRN